jgi:hypothetical protein|tara:strand:- start:53 stop:427 length:375 start_codon:yes stop_codon:yes gene_type:complete
MTVLIDRSNFNQFLKQSTQGRSGTPDGNIYFDTENGLLEFIGSDELPAFDHSSMGGGVSDTNQLSCVTGITFSGLYCFENTQRRFDERLRCFLRYTRATPCGIVFINNYKLSSSSDVDKLKMCR